MPCSTLECEAIQMGREGTDMYVKGIERLESLLGGGPGGSHGRARTLRVSHSGQGSNLA